MRALITLARLAAQAVYAVFKLTPRRRKVVFLSRQANRPSPDFAMLVEELQLRDPEIEIVVRCRAVGVGAVARIRYGSELIAQMWHLATASACVVDGYIVPVSMLEHGRGLTVIQMWHALGAIKRFGLQSVGSPGGRPAALAEAMRMHRNYDVVLCGGPGAVPFFAEAFGVAPDVVLPLGLPRVDRLRRDNAAEQPSPEVQGLLARHPELRDKNRTRVLYAPTFRRGARPAFDQVVRAFAGEGLLLIVKPHDLEEAAMWGDDVVDATGVSAIDVLSLADVVVTDYSAIAFEACVAHRPVYFFVPDIDDYRRDHGLNIDPLLDMPNISSADVGHVREMIEQGAWTRSDAELLLASCTPVAVDGCTSAIAKLVTDSVSGRRRP